MRFRNPRFSRDLDPAIEIAIVTAVATVVVVVFVAALKGIAKTADVLTFAGAATGAGLAIAGAIWVERWKQNALDRRRERVLVDLVGELRNAIAIAKFKEEPTRDPAKDIGERLNGRARFIRDTAGLVETVLGLLQAYDPPDGAILRQAIRLRRELSGHDYMIDPETFRINMGHTWLTFTRRYYEEAEGRAGPLLEDIDTFLGAIEAYGVTKVQSDAFSRIPNPPLALI